MFTGIVQGKAIIESITGSKSLKSFKISFPPKALDRIQRGASIAVNGTCLTVTSFNSLEAWATFDVIQETLKLTNLGALNDGDEVNFERAAAFGDEIGGHLMSGHILSTVEVFDITSSATEHTIHFKTPKGFAKYLLTKGFVGLNGCSLTLGNVSDSTFAVHLIPETLEATTFSTLKIGMKVNLEIDPQTQTIVDTVERIMSKG